MPNTHNLRFVANSPPDQFDQPPGAGLLRSLCRDLSAAGWTTGAVENWRDCGWSATCRRSVIQLELVLIPLFGADDEWILQIAAENRPWRLGWLVGRPRSAEASDVFEVSVVVHRVLDNGGLLRNPRWCWDGFPDNTNSTAGPMPPE